MKIKLRLESDSDNSYSSDVEIEIKDETITFELSGPDRTISFNKENLIKVIKFLA